MKIKNVNLNLESTITCGQIFRFYKEEDNSFTVIYSDRVINLKMDGNDLIIDSNNMDNIKEIVSNYLSLNKDYESINDYLLKKDPNLKEIISFCNGFKVMKTPKYETIISYIISQNNRVNNIKNSLDLISKEYGKKILFNNKEYYLFPDKKDLKRITLNDLKEAKVGFRDKYIYDFINSDFDEEIIDNLNTKDALEYLKHYKGIGQKVASCILIFAYERYDVFPIDTWVKKYMLERYNLKTINEIEKYAKDKYDKYCGLFIQYIFHYNRNN